MKNEIVVVACDGENVSLHFGRCEGYIFFKIENGEITEKKFVQNPGHQPGFLPEFLKENGVNTLIAGGAGPRAIELLKSYGIKCVLGVSGDVNTVIDQYIKGELKSGESSCNHN